MKLLASQEQPTTYTGDCLIIGMPEGQLQSNLLAIDARLDGAIQKLIDRKAFTGEKLKVKSITTLGKLPFHTLIIVGLGKEPTNAIYRKAGAVGARAAREHGTKAALAINNTAALEGALLGLYRYRKYKSHDKELDQLDCIGFNESDLKRTQTLCDNVCLVRDLINEGASNKHPAMLERLMRDHLQGLPIKITVLGKKELEQLGMHAILAVNRGSVHEPRMILLEYSGSTAQPLALVGKGITFDTGGLSLKPADGMEDMKCDMSGAAAVFGTFKTIAEMKLPVHVLGFLAITENMPGEDAYKPGDIIHSYAKKTIEVLNTDAEGRLVLADALAYAETFKPSAIIDLATLTGAVVVALGNHASGAIGTDQALINKILAAAEATDDRVWQLPLYEEFIDAMKSDVADLKNISSRGFGAGSSTGAGFLRSFVGTTPWCHLDIAGTAWHPKDNLLNPRGGTGAGVRLLVKLLEDWK